MTDEQINIAIAEACGWHDLSIVDKTACGLRQKVTSLNGRYEPIPDHVNDLNAMHEAEKVLMQEQEDKYVMTLCLEVQLKSRLHHATTVQRAEAFLRTIGKWEEARK